MQVDFTQFNCQLNNTNLNYFQIKYCGMTMRKTAKGLSNKDVLITKFWQHIYSSNRFNQCIQKSNLYFYVPML